MKVTHERNNRILRWLVLGPVFALLVLAWGCQSTWSLRKQTDDGQTLTSPTGTGLVASQDPKIADVPMPVGFLAVASRSNSFVPPTGPRIVNHVYQGVASVTDATTFYRQNVPPQGWQFVRERSDGSITTMVYVKGVEELVIQISHPRVLDVVVTIRDRNSTAKP